MARNGLRIFTPAAGPHPSAGGIFRATYPIEARVVLVSLRDASELLRRLLDRGHSVVAGRPAGALRGIGRSEAADEIVTTMKAAGYDVRENDPFASHPRPPRRR